MTAMLRPYQEISKAKIYDAWGSGFCNVLYTLPTGGGKTRLMAHIVSEHTGSSCVVAHRQELVTQISCALAAAGVRHRIVGPISTVKLAVRAHMVEIGASYYDPNARVAVAGVDTLLRRGRALDTWLPTVTLWMIDEAHHVLQSNKWGAAVGMFPTRARGLGVTATPVRSDGAGLGRDSDGVFDVLIEGPSMRDLMELGFLTDYRIFAPPSDLDLSSVKISTTGDYEKTSLSRAVKGSKILGDITTHYLRIAQGKLGITFATDVASAHEIAQNFNNIGVPSAALSAETSDEVRIKTLQKFRSGELRQLVNVDLFGEGFDLPAIEVVSMARPTQSYSLYAQQFGRALRMMPNKSHALIIDHVGNVMRHGIPDAPCMWSLDRREKRPRCQNPEVPDLRVCTQCTGVYARSLSVCPYCTHAHTPTSRARPEYVDGDLHELDPETLLAMRQKIANIDRDPDEYRAELIAKKVPHIGQLANVKRHVARQNAQNELRYAIARWGGINQNAGRTDAEGHRLFYKTFKIDVLSAQALGTEDANKLQLEIENDIRRLG